MWCLLENINTGNDVIVCKSCDEIFHKKCSKEKNYILFRNEPYCQKFIMAKEMTKYNSFYSLLQDDKYDKFFEEEPPEYIEKL